VIAPAGASSSIATTHRKRENCWACNSPGGHCASSGQISLSIEK
jgi:hypothetical protein